MPLVNSGGRPPDDSLAMHTSRPARYVGLWGALTDIQGPTRVVEPSLTLSNLRGVGHVQQNNSEDVVSDAVMVESHTDPGVDAS
ncbi:hypothetical protein V6N13_059565 [Hibiscus sabdariffa]